MAAGKLYTGIALEGESLKIAVIRIAGKRIQLVKLDKFQLLDKLEFIKTALKESNDLNDIEAGLDDDVFDLDSALNDDDGILGEINLDDDLIGDLDDDNVLGEIKDDIDLELEELESGDEIVDVDLMDETDGPASNEIQMFNLFSGINPKRVDLGLNIPAGTAIFQVIKDIDFNEVKAKDLKVIIDDRLEALHGTIRDSDYYSYGVRGDGALVLSSIDDEPILLGLVDRASSLYRGKIFIGEILPDETILMGLVKANYELDDDGITCIIQFGETNSRVIFLKGSGLWLVSPMITEGTRSRKFLNTLFSKILFQLDTGEVPNLDRLIICNNSMGEEGISFFKERFPDIEVSEFNFSDEIFDPADNTLESVAPFTTAIGMAVAVSGFKKEEFSKISFLPKYVIDRQKIFKLQWHGLLLLIMILFSFPAINFFWKSYFTEISNLENQVLLLDTQIESFAPTVNSYNRVSSQLSQIQDKLVLMNTLAENSITWSVNLNRINSGIEEIGGVWLTGITPGDQPNTLNIEGVARSREKISRVADIFASATLLDVTISEIREVDIFSFSYSVEKIVENTSIYTPQNLQGLGDLTGE
jgi:Tfp pilus assembly protein PilN